MSSQRVQARRQERVCRWPTWLCAVLLIVPVIASGCAKARAATEPQMPALAVPPPPPRVLPPLEGQPIDASVPAPAEPQTRPRPPRQRGDATRPGANGARSEARAEGSTTSVPVEPAPETEVPAQPAPALQLAPAGDAGSEQNTKRLLAQAERDLQRVDYRLLNTDAKAQYDTAKRFIALAAQAILDRNLLFAHTLAGKAATIAAVLQRR